MAQSTATEPSVDVIVLGGGLAGLAATNSLEGSGLTVALLEASDRLGGRAYGEYWSAAGRAVDLGGTWLLPTFDRAFELLGSLGIETCESPISDLWLAHLRHGPEVRQTLTAEELAELGRVLETLHNIAAAANEPLSAEAALELAQLEDPAPSPVIEDWLRATQRYLAGAPLVNVDVAHLLLAIEDIANPEHYCTQILGTTKALVDALADHSAADIRLNSAAVRVTLANSVFAVETDSGEKLTAKHVIVAVPLNRLAAIYIEEALLGSYSGFANEGHAGNSRKDWLVLDGVPDHFRVYGSHGPFGYLRSEEKLADGGMLVVGLAPAAEGPHTVTELEAEIRANYLPEATIRAHLTHDWSADANAAGTWFVPRPGQHAALAGLRTSHPNLQVVGGDFDPAFPGTLEGAIASGQRAAAVISGAGKS